MSVRRGKLWSRTVFLLILATVAGVVLLPVFYFLTISFASNYEAYQFPAKIFPTFSYPAQLRYNADKENYTLLIKKGADFEAVKTTSDTSDFSLYCKSQLNVLIASSEVQALFDKAKGADHAIPIKLKKAFFRNYVVFFILAEGTMRALFNSLKAAGWTILISLVLGGVTGYILARYKFRFSNTFSTGLLVVRMFPAVALSLPLVVYIVRMNLYDTPFALAIVYSVPNIALTAWITSSIFKGISVELEEAAMVFGATRLKTLLTITFPLAFPAIVASSLYAFLAAWNDSITALIMTNDNPTLALLVYRTVGSSTIPNLPAAGAVVLLVPSLVFTFIIKNYINQLWGNVAL
ncbi:ABC transporter permease [uncultured spirochete]|jgi:multiple sugar transport system permease protein|uniref:ABC transporter permease n=1 Tax=uncultured spirochete TaxID=156406 RepID=A0A3P3XPZ9_9SPIR|nr:ABC transporter permease [uncultured spirochete]